MIKLQNYTPDVYSKQSRDFQFISRLFDIMLNFIKTNSNTLYNLPLNDNINEKYLELMSMTLGFKSLHNYNYKQLKALCASFMQIIKMKGSLGSVKLAGDALTYAEGITEEFYCSIDRSTDGEVTNVNLVISQGFPDTNLLRDLLNYVLPAGMTATIIKEVKDAGKVTLPIALDENTIKYSKQERLTSIVPKAEQSGLVDTRAKDTPGLLVNSTVVRTPSDND